MHPNGKWLAPAVGLAVAVIASWIVAYRMGTHSGQILAIEVTGVPADTILPPPLPVTPAATGSRAAASPASRPAPPPIPLASDPEPVKLDLEAEEPAPPSEQAIGRFLTALDTTQGQSLLNHRLRQAASELGLADISETIGALAALPAGPRREAALLVVVGRWAQLDPSDAVQYAEEEAVPSLRGQMIQATFSGWALSNPTAALGYLEENPDWPHREAASHALFEAVAERPSADAFQFLEGLDPEPHNAMIQRTLGRMVGLDPLAVRNWAQGLPESPLREAAIARSVTSWANYQPEQAKDWAMENLEGDPLARQLPSLAGAWARNDPEAARDWFLELPGELQSARIGEEVFESWMEEDWDAAREYLDGAPPRAELDQGFKEYAYRVQRHDPSQAMDLTGRILDEDTRLSTQSRVGRYWAQRNPRAVLGYLESSSIPVDEQAPLIRYAESRLKQQSQRNRR